jgi:hypothetical protein
VELVVDDPGVGQMPAQALHEGLPHVHADGPDEAAAPARQGLGEVAVQRLALALPAHPHRLPGLEVADHGQELHPLTQEDLVHPEVTEGCPRPPGRPAVQDPLVQAPDRGGRQPPLDGHAADRGVLTVLRHRGLQPCRVAGLARQPGDVLCADPTAGTSEAMHLHDQPHRPGAPRQISHPPLGPAVDVPPRLSTPATQIRRVARLPNPQRQDAGGFRGLPGVHPIARQV